MANIFNKFLNFIGVEEDEEEEYEEDVQTYEPRTQRPNGHSEPQPYRTQQQNQQPRPYGVYSQQERQTGAQQAAYAQKKGGKVVAHPSYETGMKHQTTIYQINEHTETRAVIDDLLAGKSVLLNLENLDAVESQRVIDMLSGASYAIAATLKKAAHQTYFIAPSNVEIGGSFADESKRPANTMFKGRAD